MSQPTRTAVVAAMTADSALVALLAKDPDDNSAPAIFNGSKSQASPVYNCLTYRIGNAAPDGRFRPPIVGGGGSSKVQDEYFDIEAWSDKPDSADIEAIGVRLAALFDNKALSISGGHIYRAELISAIPDLYDNVLNCWFGLFRYRIRTQL